MMVYMLAKGVDSVNRALLVLLDAQEAVTSLRPVACINSRVSDGSTVCSTLFTIGEVLEDGVIGTDEAREAKIEETLRKMGVQSIGEVRAEKAKALEEEKNKKSMGQQITSIFDVSLLCLQHRDRSR